MIKSQAWLAIGLVFCLNQGYASNKDIEKSAIPQYVAPQNFVNIPAGSFVMGCQDGRDSQCTNDEKPAHTVMITPFKIMTHEVTFAQWDLCVEFGTCRSPDDRDWGRGQRPVVSVNWKDIQVYIQWLKKHTGQTYRLPSEAEWEYAARAGGHTNYAWGNSIGKGNANCTGCGSQWDNKQTAPVGSFAPNAFGLYDMHGNVWEWVQDRWHSGYKGAPSDGSAWEVAGSSVRVLRGGSWLSVPRFLRSAYRYDHRADFHFNSYGFRLVTDQ